MSIHAENFIQNLHYPQRSTNERESDFKQNRFSHAIEMIEEDSNNSLDVLYFMTLGNSEDLILRTNMRTMAIHFAGDNLGNKQAYQTSKELNVYCAYDSQLLEKKFFIESLEKNSHKGKVRLPYFQMMLLLIELTWYLDIKGCTE